MAQILVIGATGYVGTILARHFVAAGHSVSGLVRSPERVPDLEAAGIVPILADLDERIDDTIASARSADVIVYAAQVAFEREPDVVGTLCRALAGSSKTFLFLSGSGVFLQRTGGRWSPDVFAEDDPFTPEPLAAPRVEAETIVRAAAAAGLRSMVVRPPIIWGPGDNGPVAQIYRSVAATGSACHVGEGLAAYSNVHSADLAGLFDLAIERGSAGALYHAVGGEIPYRWIAEAVAHDLGVSTRSLSMAEAEAIFGPFGALLHSACSRSRDPLTRAELGWTPAHSDMLDQIGEPRLRALATNPEGDIR